jgi:hypothetical protein
MLKLLQMLQLTAKIIVTALRNRTSNHDLIESDQCVDFISKMFGSKFGRD